MRALAINPNSTWAHAAHGAVLLFSGRFQEARTAFGAALRLDPSGPISVLPLSQIALSYYLEGNYPEAANAARRTVFRYPQINFGYRTLAATLGQLGRVEEARAPLQAAEANAVRHSRVTRRLCHLGVSGAGNQGHADDRRAGDLREGRVPVTFREGVRAAAGALVPATGVGPAQTRLDTRPNRSRRSAATTAL
ncbi:MAG: tetratricopeptide repeat protein [Pseudolabrys sp.]